MSETTTLDAVDIHALLRYLPHRYPFLLVDRIVDIKGTESCIGIKNVTFNEPQFQGHFPGRPVFPGVLLIEGMAQTGGALIIHSELKGRAPPLVYFLTIDEAKFRKPVGPGDQVRYHMVREKNRRNIWWFAAQAMVDGQLVAEAKLSAMLLLDEDKNA